jgi:hypothetical protein
VSIAALPLPSALIPFVKNASFAYSVYLLSNWRPGVFIDRDMFSTNRQKNVKAILDLEESER